MSIYNANELKLTFAIALCYQNFKVPGADVISLARLFHNPKSIPSSESFVRIFSFLIISLLLIQLHLSLVDGLLHADCPAYHFSTLGSTSIKYILSRIQLSILSHHPQQFETP